MSGVLISIPAMLNPSGAELLTMPLLAAVGVLGGVLRDLAPTRMRSGGSLRFSISMSTASSKRAANHRRTAFHLEFSAGILVAEFLRRTLEGFFPPRLWSLTPEGSHPQPWSLAAIYATTLFAVAIPLKIWNNTRNEKKLEEQERLLRRSAPGRAHQPDQSALSLQYAEFGFFADSHGSEPGARHGGATQSKVLRRLLRKHENFSTLRDELSFIEDYLAIEVVRFGDKLRFERDVAEDTLDMLVPSMLLQPLVENSIKHGLSSKVEGGTIRIRTLSHGKSPAPAGGGRRGGYPGGEAGHSAGSRHRG